MSTVRKVVVRNLPFLLSDTVGFIRKLPTQLVESFKSTLDEVHEADMLLHVVDIAHSNFEEQIESVNHLLSEIGAIDKPMLVIFNKIDAYKADILGDDDLTTPRNTKHYSLEKWHQSWMARTNGNSIFISAQQKTHINKLQEMLYQKVRDIHITRFPYNHFLYPET